jgi:hypothetical protein
MATQEKKKPTVFLFCIFDSAVMTGPDWHCAMYSGEKARARRQQPANKLRPSYIQTPSFFLCVCTCVGGSGVIMTFSLPIRARYCRHTRLEVVISFIFYFFYLIHYNFFISPLPFYPMVSLSPSKKFFFQFSQHIKLSSFLFFFSGSLSVLFIHRGHVDMLQVIGWRFIPNPPTVARAKIKIKKPGDVVKWTRWIVTQLSYSIYPSNLPLFSSFCVGFSLCKAHKVIEIYTKRRNKRQVTAKPKRKRKIDDIAQCHTFYSFQPHRNKKKKKKRWMEKSFFTIDIIFFVGNISRYIWCIELLQVIIFFFLYNKMANLFFFETKRAVMLTAHL